MKYTIIVLLCIICIIQYKCKETPETKTLTIEKTKYQHDTVVKQIIVNGKTHYIKKTLVVTKEQFKDQLDSLSKEFDIKSNQVDELMNAVLITNGKEETSLSEEFSDNYNYFFNKGSLKAHVVISEDLKDAELEYSQILKINGAVYWKYKHPFILFRPFSSKVYEQQLYCDDSNTKVDKLSSIKIIKK